MDLDFVFAFLIAMSVLGIATLMMGTIAYLKYGIFFILGLGLLFLILGLYPAVIYLLKKD